MRRPGLIAALLLAALLAACTTPTSTTSTTAVSSTLTSQTSATSQATTTSEAFTTAVYDAGGQDGGITIDRGGDFDFEVVSVGGAEEQAVRSGNGAALAAADGNGTADLYLQFSVTNDLIYAGRPTSRVRVEVEYLDEATDTFNIQYDAVSGGPSGDGTFKDTGVVVKDRHRGIPDCRLLPL